MESGAKRGGMLVAVIVAAACAGAEGAELRVERTALLSGTGGNAVNLLRPRAEAEEVFALERVQPAEEGGGAEGAASEPASFWEGWTGTVEAGLNGSDGNSESLNVRGSIGASRKTSKMETTIGLLYTYGSSDGEESQNRGEFNVKNEWLFGKDSRWGFFAMARAEYDAFQDWDWRLSGFLGPSYAFIRNDRTLLRGRVGFGGSYEIGGDDEEFTPELLIGADFEHKLNDRQKLYASVEYLPSLSEFPEYRVNAKAGWEIVVDPETKMFLKLGIEDRYDSSPGEGNKRNDIDYFATIGWAF